VSRDLCRRIGSLVPTISPAECRNYFQTCRLRVHMIGICFSSGRAGPWTNSRPKRNESDSGPQWVFARSRTRRLSPFASASL